MAGEGTQGNRNGQKLSDDQVSAIQELHRIGMGIQQISDCLKINIYAVANEIKRNEIPTTQKKSKALQKNMSIDMVIILNKLIEDSPKLCPREIKQICNDFDNVANKSIQKQIDKTLFKVFGVKSSYDIADSIVDVDNECGGEATYSQCYYDSKSKTIIKEGHQTSDEENICGIDNQVNNQRIQEIDTFNEEKIVQKLEEEFKELQNATLEASIRCEILQAENESLLLDIQDLQEKKFPSELESMLIQDIKIEPVI